MNDIQRTVLKKEINQQLQGQKDKIQEEITQGFEEGDSLEKLCAKMVVNAVSLSVHIAAQMFCDMLADMGLVDPDDEDTARRKLFSVVGRPEKRGG